jgi:hypothetical protein
MSAAPPSAERSAPTALNVWEGSCMQGEEIWIYIKSMVLYASRDVGFPNLNVVGAPPHQESQILQDCPPHGESKSPPNFRIVASRVRFAPLKDVAPTFQKS